MHATHAHLIECHSLIVTMLVSKLLQCIQGQVVLVVICKEHDACINLLSDGIAEYLLHMVERVTAAQDTLLSSPYQQTCTSLDASQPRLPLDMDGSTASVTQGITGTERVTNVGHYAACNPRMHIRLCSAWHIGRNDTSMMRAPFTARATLLTFTLCMLLIYTLLPCVAAWALATFFSLAPSLPDRAGGGGMVAGV